MARLSLSRCIGGTIGIIVTITTIGTTATIVAGRSRDTRRPLRSCHRLRAPRMLTVATSSRPFQQHNNRARRYVPRVIYAASTIRALPRIQSACANHPKSVFSRMQNSVHYGRRAGPRNPNLGGTFLSSTPRLPAKTEVGVQSAKFANVPRAPSIAFCTSACVGTCGQSSIMVITPSARRPIRMCDL
jgi:hypothetical protein